jgi:hypothetical protein
MKTEKKTTSQRFAFIPLDSIEASDYQRSTNPTQVKNITENFDEARLGTLTVSQRGGKYYIIDGAHRLAALRNLKFTHAVCLILTGLTHEQEAEYFCAQKINNRPLRPYDLFKGGLIAGDEMCLRINETVKSNNFKIGYASKNFYQIGALDTLFTIAGLFGYEILDDTLCLIANTWAGIARATSGEVLMGVAEFVSRYGVCDFDRRLCDSFSVIWYEYREITRKAYHSTAARKNFCRILVEYYNKGFASNSKKRLKWEG